MVLTRANPEKLVLLTAAAILFFMLAGYAHSATDPMEALGILRLDKPEKAPEFTLRDTKGEKVSLSDYRGKALFITFWATW
jgi:cytochrome oxidase Cu insertion factor (SCO1/SenC/PrrC family)